MINKTSKFKAFVLKISGWEDEKASCGQGESICRPSIWQMTSTQNIGRILKAQGSKNKLNKITKRAKDNIRHFTQENLQRQISTWKYIQHNSSLGKYKLKPQRVITINLPDS